MLAHVAPLTDFVERLRAVRPDAAIPYFDPTETGVEATILGLFEAAGPKATPPAGSGFVSADNNDQTEQNNWRLHGAAQYLVTTSNRGYLAVYSARWG